MEAISLSAACLGMFSLLYRKFQLTDAVAFQVVVPFRSSSTQCLALIQMPRKRGAVRTPRDSLIT